MCQEMTLLAYIRLTCLADERFAFALLLRLFQAEYCIAISVRTPYFVPVHVYFKSSLISTKHFVSLFIKHKFALFIRQYFPAFVIQTLEFSYLTVFD